MWTRKSVKQRGKKAFTLNYWKCVLVALILSIILGATCNSWGGAFPSITNSFSNSNIEETSDDPADLDMDPADITDDEPGFVFDIDFDDDMTDQERTGIISAIIVVLVLGFIVWIVATAISLAIKYLLLEPFEYGCRKFFRKNLDEPAKLSNIVYVFDSHYKNVVKTAFMTDLFIWLWSLLFVIPGIIKTYEYRLVPYIVSENPSISYKDALAESKKLMMGNKWKTFVLDLSFIGWELLGGLTWGILDILYVGPYKASTDAALYEAIKYGIDAK